MEIYETVEVGMHGITVCIYRRQNDYIAYVKEVPGIWAAGPSEFVALDKLIVSIFGELKK